MAGRFIVRRATRADSAGFLELLVGLANFERLHPPSQSARRRILRDIFDRRLANLLLAYSGGKPVAYALYFYTYSSFLARPTLYLEDIFVAAEFRRSGAGRSLFLRSAQEAVRHGCGRMEWSVLTWNKGAMRFYEKLGARRLVEWAAYRLDSKSLKKLGSAVSE